MKLDNLLLFTILGVSSLLVFSCSKDDTSEAETPLLVGKWTFYKEGPYSEQNNNDTLNNSEFIPEGEVIFTFNGDGTLIIFSRSHSETTEGTYSYNPETQEMTLTNIWNGKASTETAKVVEFTSISLVLCYIDLKGRSCALYFKRIK